MNTVNWRNLKITYVRPSEWNDTINHLLNEGYVKCDGSFPVRKYEKFIRKYSFTALNTTLEIEFINDNDGEPTRMRCDKGATGNADSTLSGYTCYKEVERIWQEKNNTKKTIFTAFTGRKYADDYKAIKKCVPLQISYINKSFIGRTVKGHCYKADVSSAFPYQMTKEFPTLQDNKKVAGIAEPSKDYPYAFYLKSHHIKVFSELDTHEFNTPFYPKYDELFDDTVKPEEEITILCKTAPSKYSFAETFKELYAHRKENADNKQYMNATIGFFHKNTDPTLSFIAAVVIARNNKRMIDYANRLEAEGNVILYIATDCIVWCGKPSDIATEDKHLGTFTYEGKNGSFYGWMVGSYQYIDEDGILTTKSTYIDNGPVKDNLKFGELPPPGNPLLMGYMYDECGRIICL